MSQIPLTVNPDVLKQLTDRAVMTKDQFIMLPDELRMRAFTIAKQTEASVLQDTLDALRQTIEKGGTLWDFKQNFPDIVAPYTEAGRDWHLNTVFQENVRQARAVGAHQAQQRVKAAFPYVEYQAGKFRGDIEPRPSHTALHGKIFAVDDPFVPAHTGPWDFGCNCTWIPRTAAQVGRVQEAEKETPPPHPTEQRVVAGNPALEARYQNNTIPDPAAPHRSISLLSTSGYSFRPDRLNQALDLSRFDAEIRTKLIEQLKTVGYRLADDGITAVPVSSQWPVPPQVSGDASLGQSDISASKHLGKPRASRVAAAHISLSKSAHVGHVREARIQKPEVRRRAA